MFVTQPYVKKLSLFKVAAQWPDKGYCTDCNSVKHQRRFNQHIRSKVYNFVNRICRDFSDDFKSSRVIVIACILI
jgi:hypothetical protein